MFKAEIVGKRRMWRGENRGWTPTYVVDEETKLKGLYAVIYRGTDKAKAEAYLQGKEKEHETQSRLYIH